MLFFFSFIKNIFLLVGLVFFISPLANTVYFASVTVYANVSELCRPIFAHYTMFDKQ